MTNSEFTRTNFKKVTFSVGDKVKFDNGSLWPEYGVIIKTNKKTATVEYKTCAVEKKRVRVPYNELNWD